jgi:hypothetical protein
MVSKPSWAPNQGGIELEISDIKEDESNNTNDLEDDTKD